MSELAYELRRCLASGSVTSPWASDSAELEILHLGPYFTGEGVFRLVGHDGRTTVRCTEVFSIPGGRPIEWLARFAMPVLRGGFGSSLRTLAAVAEAR
jgi:hypothetical protein